MDIHVQLKMLDFDNLFPKLKNVFLTVLNGIIETFGFPLLIGMSGPLLSENAPGK